jgi:hypothetical protein
MALPQTTETASQVLTGAVKIEVSASANMAGAVDIGAANGVKYTEEMKVSTLENDNAVDRDIVTEQKGMIEFEQTQMLNEAARAIMRGSLDTIVTNAGSAVPAATQLVVSGTWDFNEFIEFANQNGDGTIITVGSVVGATDGALVAETDYFVTLNPDGKYGIIIIDSTDVTTIAQNVTITYAYTPNASVDYYTGGMSELPFFYVRLTNENEDGDTVVWLTTGKCNLAKGDEIVFKKYNADDPRVPIPVSIQVRQDISLATGRQLMKRTVTPAV